MPVGPHHLVTGEGEEIGPQGAEVDRQMGHPFAPSATTSTPAAVGGGGDLGPPG